MKNTEEGVRQHPEIADLFESCFIEIVQKLAEKNNIKKGVFASEVWPASTPLVARNRWANMRGTGSKKKNPLSCTLSDAYRMAKALGFQITYVVLQAENMAEQKFEQMNQGASDSNKTSAIKRRGKRALDTE